jgi:hypothetical protein
VTAKAKRGRPPGPVLGGAPAYVRASPEERARWDAAAAEIGWSTSQWLRAAAELMLLTPHSEYVLRKKKAEGWTLASETTPEEVERRRAVARDRLTTNDSRPQSGAGKVRR